MVWLPVPGDDPPVPPGARLIRGSADLPGAHLLDLVATMDRLRVECPWDAQQTHQSLAPHLLEEPFEALEALESGDEQALCEELGDVLLQVMFHARIAAERDDGTGFDVDDVADGIVAKLVRRHPHVFADVSVSGAEEVKRNWDEIKREEKRAQAAQRGEPADGQVARRCLTACRSGSPPCHWPRNCSAGRPGRPYLTSWPAWRTVPGRLASMATSAVSCSAWSRRRVRRGSIPRQNCAPPPVASVTLCAPGSGPVRDQAELFSIDLTLVHNEIAVGDLRSAMTRRRPDLRPSGCLMYQARTYQIL